MDPPADARPADPDDARPLVVGFAGTAAQTASRRRAAGTLRGVRMTARPVPAPDLFAAPAEERLLRPLLEEADVVFVGVTAGTRFAIAEAAMKRGAHVFLEWPPVASVHECERLVAVAEEAGVEVGVSRPLRYHPLFEAVPAGWRAELILFRQEVAVGAPPRWPERLTDALDACCALAQSTSVQRIDAASVAGPAAWPAAMAFGLRFHSGTYAQVDLYGGDEAPRRSLYAAGADLQLAADLERGPVRRRVGDAPFEPVTPAPETPVEAETCAFLQAVQAGRPAPVSVLDALHTLRLVERLMQKLR